MRHRRTCPQRPGGRCRQQLGTGWPGSPGRRRPPPARKPAAGAPALQWRWHCSHAERPCKGCFTARMPRGRCDAMARGGEVSVFLQRRSERLLIAHLALPVPAGSAAGCIARCRPASANARCPPTRTHLLMQRPDAHPPGSPSCLLVLELQRLHIDCLHLQNGHASNYAICVVHAAASNNNLGAQLATTLHTCIALQRCYMLFQSFNLTPQRCVLRLQGGNVWSQRGHGSPDG